MDKILEPLEKKYHIVNKHIQRPNLAFVTIEKKNVVDAIVFLRDYLGYKHLVMISAVDFIEQNTFQLTYLLHNYETHTDIGLRVFIDRRHPEMISIHHLWAAARVYQQELNEMYGIDFPDSPGVDEPMILEGWEDIPPMRKEFDTKTYAEETFFEREGRITFDPRVYMAKKMYQTEADIKKEIRDITRRSNQTIDQSEGNKHE